jgi:benzoyl-CoA reductase/2-hydroxyglutaryl-CoA dehydratase subunit BcrC/BadD/HgdB
MMMDRDTVADLLPIIVTRLEQTKPPVTSAKRIVVSGSICDSPGFYTAIEAAGGAIVGDDLCTGRRWFEKKISEDGDPLAAIAERYMDRMNCPAKHTTLTARGENILALAEKNTADGVIFMLQKFCDPHAFDIPYLKTFLDEKKIKHMTLEMDDQQQNAGQLSTRIETFIHMI